MLGELDPWVPAAGGTPGRVSNTAFHEILLQRARKEAKSGIKFPDGFRIAHSNWCGAGGLRRSEALGLGTPLGSGCRGGSQGRAGCCAGAGRWATQEQAGR